RHLRRGWREQPVAHHHHVHLHSRLRPIGWRTVRACGGRGLDPVPDYRRRRPDQPVHHPRTRQQHQRFEEEQIMTTSQRPPLTRRRRSKAAASNRPGLLGYAFLAIVILSALFPLYWSFLIGSGDSTTINRELDWLPGGNFLKNAAAVIENDSVNFWKALLNSIIVSTVVSFSVVLFSTLAGYAFAKLRFRGSKGLLAFVIATMAVPTQLGI